MCNCYQTQPKKEQKPKELIIFHFCLHIVYVFSCIHQPNSCFFLYFGVCEFINNTMKERKVCNENATTNATFFFLFSFFRAQLIIIVVEFGCDYY